MSATPVLRIGSRSSPLARWQAEWVAARVAATPVLVWVRSERYMALNSLFPK